MILVQYHLESRLFHFVSVQYLVNFWRGQLCEMVQQKELRTFKLEKNPHKARERLCLLNLPNNKVYIWGMYNGFAFFGVSAIISEHKSRTSI